MGTGAETLHGRSVCRTRATFQAYSDDSPLRVELITGLIGSGRSEHISSMPMGRAFTAPPAGPVGNLAWRLHWTGSDDASLGSRLTFYFMSHLWERSQSWLPQLFLATEYHIHRLCEQTWYGAITHGSMAELHWG